MAAVREVHEETGLVVPIDGRRSRPPGGDPRPGRHVGSGGCSTSEWSACGSTGQRRAISGDLGEPSRRPSLHRCSLVALSTRCSRAAERFYPGRLPQLLEASCPALSWTSPSSAGTEGARTLVVMRSSRCPAPRCHAASPYDVTRVCGGTSARCIRAGLGPVAGADEAGRGACAGPLVVAAVVLPEGKRGQVPGLADSKLLTPQAREAVYARGRALGPTAWSVVVIPPGDVDRRGLHVCNLAGMRRASCACRYVPSYVLTDGFPVRGLPMPGARGVEGRPDRGLRRRRVGARQSDPGPASWSSCTTRFPSYEFAAHKGYVTPEHSAALRRHGPCPEHRFSYVNVARAGAGRHCACRRASWCGQHDGRPAGVERRESAAARTAGCSEEASRTRDERRGSREVRDRDGAAALSRVPRHRRPFSYVVETERRFYLTNSVDLQVAQRRRRGLLRGPDVRRLGLGHVPAGPVREERARS